MSEWSAGYRKALETIVGLAVIDLRTKLAKEHNFIPGWQQGRWDVAELAEGMLKNVPDGPKKD